MLELTSHQHVMLKEMGIEIPTISDPTELCAEQPHENTPQPSLDADRRQAQTPDHFAARQPTTETVHTPQQPKANHAPAQTPTQAPIQAPSIQSDETALGRARAIAQMTWEELEETVRQCNACQLCQSRTQAVLGVGSREAQWMIVGEAPGEQEDKQGEPFVGQAGKLLDKMLAQLNIARRPQENEHPIYIGNVLKCRPPRNRNPDPQEMLVCEPFLKRQIELIQPKIIIAMGRFAVQTLLQSHEAIGKLRGKVHHYQNGQNTHQNIPVIVTYHPAYLLRNPVDKRKSWADLCLAADIFDKSSEVL